MKTSLAENGKCDTSLFVSFLEQVDLDGWAGYQFSIFWFFSDVYSSSCPEITAGGDKKECKKGRWWLNKRWRIWRIGSERKWKPWTQIKTCRKQTKLENHNLIWIIALSEKNIYAILFKMTKKHQLLNLFVCCNVFFEKQIKISYDTCCMYTIEK